MQRNKKYTLCSIQSGLSVFKAIEDNAAHFRICLQVFTVTVQKYLLRQTGLIRWLEYMKILTVLIGLDTQSAMLCTCMKAGS